MKLQLPFDAALALHQTTLRIDHPHVWRRYEENTIIRYGRRAFEAVADSTLDLDDFKILRRYYEHYYLSHCDLLGATERDAALCRAARRAVAMLSNAIAAASLSSC